MCGTGSGAGWRREEKGGPILSAIVATRDAAPSRSTKTKTEEARIVDDGVRFDCGPQAEFLEYYRDMSVNIEDEDYFELMVRNAWHISGGEGAAANSSDLRVLVIHSDGSQEVRAGPLLLSFGCPFAARRRASSGHDRRSSLWLVAGSSLSSAASSSSSPTRGARGEGGAEEDQGGGRGAARTALDGTWNMTLRRQTAGRSNDAMALERRGRYARARAHAHTHVARDPRQSSPLISSAAAPRERCRATRWRCTGGRVQG